MELETRNVKPVDVTSIKTRLMNYREMEREIDNQIERIENLQAKMSGIGSPVLSDMPKSPNTVHDRIGRMVAQKDEMERKVRKLVDIQSRERHWIQNILSHLKKADERAVIQMRYIDSESWSNVSRMLFGAKDDYEEKQESYLRRTTKLHGRALVSMAKWASVYPEDYQ